MLKVIEDENIVKRCQRELVRSLRPLVDAKVPVKLGHLGASFPMRVSWSEQLGMWFCSRKIGNTRYWNAFGVGKPIEASAIPITCEINFPIRGIDRRMGGTLAEDRIGRIFVAHRGKIGGGRRGVGKSLFEGHYRGVWTAMEDGGEENAVALIGMLKSPRFPRQIAQFVRKIHQIKQHADPPHSTQLAIFDDMIPKEEFMGEGIDTARLDLASLCDYGLVVRDLSAMLAGRGLRAGNDGRRDLFVVDDRGRVEFLFQIVSDPSTMALHTGIGRLMLLASELPEKPALVLVSPALSEYGLMDGLKRLDIHHLAYEWEGSRAIFPGLGLLLSVRR